MTRTTKKSPEKQASAADREQLQRIARKMLDRLERSVDSINDLDDAHDKLFGAKNSLVGALVTLTELVTNLADSPPEDATEEEVEIKMSESDIALVKSFIAKSQAIESKQEVKQEILPALDCNSVLANDSS